MSRESEPLRTRAIFEGLKTTGIVMIFCGASYIGARIGWAITDPNFVKANQERARQSVSVSTPFPKPVLNPTPCAPGTQDLRCYTRIGP